MPGLLEKDQVGKREWLADTITIADQKEKPLLAMIPKGKKVVNTLAQWQADNYATPSTTGVVDGTDVTNFENAAANRALLKTYCQLSRRTALVSKFADQVSDVAGASSGDLARSIDKKLEEIGRDMEATMCSDNDTQADDGTLPYQTRGLGSWIQATAQTTLPVDSNYRPPTASIDTTAMASLTETLFKGVLKSIYGESGKAQELTLIVGQDLKTTITGFTQFQGGSSNAALTIRSYTADLASKKITHNVTIYEGDFNTVFIVPSLLLASGTSNAPTRRGYVLDMSMLELSYNQYPKVSKLPDLGGGPRALIDAIYCLKVLNPRALGKFAATS